MAGRGTDDRKWVELHKAGDQEAFTSIVNSYYSELMAHARRRLYDPRASEDAVQEALLRAFRALPRFNGDYKLSAWLHRILENVCADEGNRRRREGELVDRVAGLPQTPGTDEPQAALDDSDVTEALQALSPAYRQALVLRYVEGLPYRDVAAATGVSEENARARAHRGRAVLRKALGSTRGFGKSGKGAAALLPVFLAWVIDGVRRARPSAPRPSSIITTTAARLGPATDQLLSVGATAGPAAGGMARAAALVAAVTLPMASAGIGSAIGWLDGNDAKAPEAAAASGADVFTPATPSPLAAALASVRDAANNSATASAAVPTSALPPAPANAQAKFGDLDGDTERWDWFGQNPNEDPNADGNRDRDSDGSGQDGSLSANAMGMSAQASATRLYGGGRYSSPDGLVSGQIEALLRTSDDQSTTGTEAAAFVLTFTEEGGRSQPVRLDLEGAIVSESTEGDLTRYTIEGTWRGAGHGVGADQRGSFRASMVLGSTDVQDLQVQLTPDPTK